MLRLVIKSLPYSVIRTKNCHRRKDSIRIKDNHRGDIEMDRLMEHNKRIRADEILMQNES